MLFDFSKNIINDETFKLLIDLAKERGVEVRTSQDSFFLVPGPLSHTAQMLALRKLYVKAQGLGG